MFIRQIVKLFEQGNVCVCGERGAGKDMLFANVIARRKLDYISNAEYKRKRGLQMKYYPLDFDKLDCGGNTYKNFMSGNILPYKYPYPMGVDVYITDVGVYMPSQFCSELNREYKYIPTFMALSRHVGRCNVHTTCQNFSRQWDKLREMSRRYITCLNCRVFKFPFNHQFVVQRIRIYESADSCQKNVPPLRLPWFILFLSDRMIARVYKLNYQIQHGKIKQATLFFWNKSDYDTHVFQKMLGGDPDEEVPPKDPS